MDVSIAVSLIRGQMGTVVEQAVNGAVETVLAEMLKVVGTKFEELKAELVLMKRDVAALQREKALKEKENDNIRAKLRYTELKLKYYRQGVEEELQQRASATSTLVRVHPPTATRTQRDQISAQSRSTEEVLLKSHPIPECTSSQSRRAVRVSRPADQVDPEQPDLLLPFSVVSAPAESVDSSAVLFCPAGPDPSQSKDQDEEESCDWSVALRGSSDSVEPAPQVQLQVLTVDVVGGATSLGGASNQADSSTLPPAAPQVKQEGQEEEEEEVICIKEEPEEEQEVMATLLLDSQVQQVHLPVSEAQRSVSEWSRLPVNQMNQPAVFSSAGPTYPHMVASLPSTVALPSGVPPRPAVRPWTKDLSLYEEYKLRRNELRRRNLNRRRELEKTLPQPLLADLVRERREKTRLRVARWRAKRKLQACLNQAQPHGGAAALSHTGFPISPQQLRAPCASTSSPQQRRSSAAPPSNIFLNNMSNSIAAILPFIPSSSSSSSSSLLLPGPNMAAHEHVVTSSSSSTSFPQVSQSQQSISLTDAEFLVNLQNESSAV